MNNLPATLSKTLNTSYGENAFTVVDTLNDAGFDAWWVGGCVRDMLKRGVPHDIDIATSAKPNEVLALFDKGREVPRPLGSVRIRIKTHVFEVTTFRKESAASDGRIPESIEFTHSKEDDADRRDFTINALYLDPITKELYDPFDGAGDLQENLIRFVGNPSERITHDALRILRAVRFRCRINGQYEPATYKALREHAELTNNLSGIRKLEELEKLLFTPNAEMGLEDLWELGVMQHFIPELAACKGIAQPFDYHKEGDVWNHSLQCISAFEDEHLADVRLATLFHDIGKAKTFSREERIRFDKHAEVSRDITKSVLKRLEISNKRLEKICWLIEHHMMMGAFIDTDNPMTEERKSHWYFHQWFPELLQLFWLDIAGTTPSNFSMYEKILADYHAFLDKHPRPIKLLLDGKTVMELTGLKPGPEVGELLDELYDAQVRGEVTLKKEAEEYLKELVARGW